MYKELIESFAQNNEWVKVQPPQTEENIRATEAVVGYLFPKELRDLYLEMDGDSFLFLSLQKIAETVQINRETWLDLERGGVDEEKQRSCNNTICDFMSVM